CHRPPGPRGTPARRRHRGGGPAMTPLMAKVSRRLDERGMNYTQLAREVGVDPSTVSGWATGRHFPRRSRIAAIARALDVPADVADSDRALVARLLAAGDGEAAGRLVELLHRLAAAQRRARENAMEADDWMDEALLAQAGEEDA